MPAVQERDGYTRLPRHCEATAGNDLSGSMEGAGGIGGLFARSHNYSSGNFTVHNYYFADGNGNITYMVNSSQSMVAKYRYDPFGNTISSSGILASANVYRFSSKEIHANSGMYYYGYRFYDPNLQRWINRDPLTEPAAVELRSVALVNTEAEWWLFSYRVDANLYEFVNNSPMDFADPVGLQSLPPGWVSPSKPYDPNFNPFCGPPPPCLKEAAALAANTAAGVVACATSTSGIGAALCRFFLVLEFKLANDFSKCLKAHGM